MSEATMEAPVVCTTANGIATITINRPHALNALNSAVLDGVRDAVTAVNADAIILTGAGEKAFVAGADIAEMVDLDGSAAEAFSRRGQDAFQTLADFPGPTVAAINGFALGGGLEVAMACDILIAGTNAKLGLPETTLGVVPGFGGTQRLPRRVGPGQAKKLMFTGAIIDANEALRIGLVDAVDDNPVEAAQKLLGKALRNGPIAVQTCKHLIDDGLEMDLDDAISMEAAAFGAVFETADKTEGMRAFLQKRKPSFEGA